MHRWSTLFLPTLREAPSDAEVASHKFLLRAGYVRQLGAGLYSYLFLGQRSLNKIAAIVREEMDKIAQEFLLPALLPSDLWHESGRWTAMGQNMFRLKDRKGAELCLGMTHEEVMTDLARNELRSYKQLPQIWYQIQTKFRDEPRPKSGLLRVRQFLMKDSYSFDIDEAGLDRSYQLHDAAYRAIFTRCGLRFVAVEADSGAMGGSQSQEFMVYTDAGEDLIASSEVTGYAANLEKAQSKPTPVNDLPGDALPELVHTPGKASIADVAAFFDIHPGQDIKCVAYMAERQIQLDPPKTEWMPVTAFLRGDHQVNETKLMGQTAAVALRTMDGEELAEWLGGPAGYLGPIGLKNIKKGEVSQGVIVNASLDDPPPSTVDFAFTGRNELFVVVDKSLRYRKNLVCGANKLDHHYKNVTPGRDFGWTAMADIRNANEGEDAPDAPAGIRAPLRIGKAVEIGHIFKLGRRYTEALGATVLDRNGRAVTPIMGSYGIGLERILTAAIEQSAAANPDNVALPRAIAPFEVVVTITNVRDAALLQTGERLAADLEAAGLDILLDDRDERAGVKFKDADLIGVPLRVTVGKRAAEGIVELSDRLQGTTEDIPVGEIVQKLQRP